MQPTSNPKWPTWYDVATVCRTDRRKFLRLNEELEQGKHFFSSGLVPITQHTLVIARGDGTSQRLIQQHLYTYLHFTEVLEQKAVNKVAERIAHREMDFEITSDMRMEAHTTYTDEAMHSLVSADAVYQIEQATGLKPVCKDIPEFLKTLKGLQRNLPKAARRASTFFFTVVSETMISATLSDVPKDARVVSTIREILADHAEDEGRHHSFFTRLFEHSWRQLSDHQRELMGVQFPKYTRAFVDPDKRTISAVLRAEGFTVHDIDQIIEDCYSGEIAAAIAKRASRATLKLFERNGVLDQTRVYDSFVESGLIENGKS